MARQVEDITVKLGIEGFEELNKLRGAFRELTRVTGATDTQLNNTRERLLELKGELGNTTRVNKGLTDAFSALLDEARRGSDVWQQLNKDLSNLRQESRLTDTQIQSLRKVILDETAAHSQSAASIKEHIKSLQTLREQASLNGNVHRELSADINKLTNTLNTGTKSNREHYKSLTQILAVAPDKVLNAWNNYKRILDEGTASTEKLAVAQKRLNQLSGAPRILERRKISETAAIRQDPEYIKRFATFEGKSLEEMPDVTAAWSQRLKELQQDLAFTTRNSVEYLKVAMEIAGVQRELAQVTAGYAQSLVMGLRTGTVVNSAQNIREAITALRAEMEQLDTSTAEGSRHYAENANAARSLTRQLDQLANSARHVNDVVSQAATGINKYAPSGAINPAYTKQVEDQFEELFKQAEQGNQEAIDRLLEAKRTMYEYEAQQEAQLNDEKDRLAALELKRIDEISAAQGRALQKELNRLDTLKQQRAAVREGLGFTTQQDLSSLYQNIVGLGTAGVERSQEFMGRTPRQVLNDIVTSFNKGERDVDLETRSTAIGQTIADNTTKSIVSTFAENLKSGATSAASAATKFADAAAKAINKVFGIASPSLFIIELVKNLVATYVSEMQKAHPEIRAATQRAFGQLTPERPVRRLTATSKGFELRDTASRGYRALPSQAFEPSGGGSEMDEMLRRFRSEIASLTTQPEIYQQLLNALPASRLTTDLIGAANRRSFAADLPSFMPTQRMLGPGELERVIATAAADYFKTVRTPAPINRIAGLLPPSLFESGLSPKQELRRLEALRRSEERAAAVMAEDSFQRQRRLAGPPLLNSSLFESGLSPEQELRRLVAYQRSDERAAAVMAEDRLRSQQRLAGPPLLPPAGPPPPPSQPSPALGGTAGPQLPSDIAAEIQAFGPVSKSSIRSIQNLNNVLRDYQANLSPVNKEYKELNAFVEKQIRLNERELDVRQRSSRQRLSGMQLAQGVGAALSGGIFGGPAGLVGGLGGLAVGGVGGAFAGAAYGAQIGMFGQQLAATADYSAQIDKLQIALRGIVGTQDAYNSAMAAATAATQQLNVPQETAIQGMTRLSAAVLGAGGTVNDSAFAFRAVSEAIKATGGNAEQVDGALLALTQVFSKGKVSAEELNQIAERLPGTFTLFAQASGRTGPELQKALQQGQVGLNDLMKFLEILRDRYSNTALAMASSSQEAGARLTVAINEMRDAVGSALQPIGAAFQTAFADFITTITPSVVSALKGIASAFEFLIENETASRLATLALQLGAVTAGFIALRSAVATLAAVNIAAFFTSTASSVKITGDVMATTALNAGMLTTKIASLAAVVAKPIVITILIAGAVEALKRIVEVRSAFDDFKKTTGQTSGPAWLKAMGGSALSRSQLSKLAADTSAAYNFNVSEIKKLQRQRLSVEAQLNTIDDNAAAAGLQQQLTSIDTKLVTAQTRVKNAKANLETIYKALERPGVSAAYTPTNFILPKEADKDKDKDKAAKKAKSDADSIAAHQQRLAETELDQRLRLEDTIYKHGVELDRKRYELQKNLSDLQAQNRIAKETGVTRDILSNFYQFQQDLRALTERRLDAERAVEDAKRAASSAAARAALSGQMPPSVSGTGAYKPGAFSRRVRDPDAERTGYDIVHPGGLGAPVRTPVALTITGTGFQGRGAGPAGKGYGNWISGEFELGGKKYEMVVGHFGQIDVAPGMKVPAGGSLGTQGITGRAFGAHATTHVNPKAGATTADAWNALDSITTALQQGRTLGATKLPTGVGAQQIRATTQGGRAKIEQADVANAKADLALIKQNEAAEAAALAEKFTISITQNLREQNQALTESNQLQALKNRLSYEGFSPERIELELSLEKQRIDLAKAGAAFAQARAYVTGLENISDDEKTRWLAQLNKDQGEYNDHMRTYIQLLNEAYIANQNYNQSVGTGFREGLSKYVESVGTMREATAQLTQTGIKGLEDAIVGLSTTGVFNFTQFAQSIIAETSRIIIQQLILKTIMKAIGGLFSGGGGGGGGFSFGGSSGGFDLPGFQMPDYMSGTTIPAPGTFAKGGAFGKNGIVPFAYGGIVNNPTLFQFAKGGTAATGLLGEAGPEAILPLRRGPNGRLGVDAKGVTEALMASREALGQTNGTTSAGAFDANREALAANATLTRERLTERAMAATLSAPAQPLNIKYETQVINNVEYVSADQFQRGLSDAAERGRALTLSALKNSVKTRRQVGI